MSEADGIRKVKIDPIGCYKQAFESLKRDYWLLLGVSAVAMFIGGAVPVVLIGPMMCGLYMCFFEWYRGRDFEFELVFRGFDLFVPSLIASLIMTGIALVILMPGFFIMFAGIVFSLPATESQGGQAGPPVALLAIMLAGFLFLFAVVTVAGILFLFTFPLIVDRKLTGSAAIVMSARAAVKNFWGLLGLAVINTALGLVGALACYVGTFFVLPVGFAAMTIAYRKVFPETAVEAAPVQDGSATAEPSGAAESPA